MTDWADTLVDLLQARGLALRRYAVLLCGNEHDADDLLQEALARLFAGRGYKVGPQGLEAYLCKIMANLVIDTGRRHQRWLKVRHRFAMPTHDEGRTAEASAERMDARASLETLSPQQRVCAVLRYYDDLTVPEIATRLGLAEGTVKRHLSDAARRLAEQLRTPEEGGENGDRQLGRTRS
ncbi:SigE family RNA polymerase sigma factor [Catenulispora yoronensis]|uniref:SigE family RNA polymerase sigma factor n=1 Tax=Catenulispora yoronensis TaxID=450799 RepID=A0ABN2TR22_9ACTN